MSTERVDLCAVVRGAVAHVGVIASAGRSLARNTNNDHVRRKSEGYGRYATDVFAWAVRDTCAGHACVSETVPEEANPEAEAQLRLRLVWAVRASAAGSDAARARKGFAAPEATTSRPGGAAAQRVLCVAAGRSDVNGMRRLLDAPRFNENRAQESVFYLRTPCGLYATEIKQVGRTAESFGVQAIEVHAWTDTSLAGATGADVRLETVVLRLAVDDHGDLEPVESALREGRTEALEEVLRHVYDELLADVFRAPADYARRLQAGARINAGGPVEDLVEPVGSRRTDVSTPSAAKRE